MTIKIQQGDYFKIEGLTQEQYKFLVGKFLEAGCGDLYVDLSANLEGLNCKYLEWYYSKLCTSNKPEPSAREIKLTDFKEYQMNNATGFPDYNFKLDCGDDPRVRQWLTDNGVTWCNGDSVVSDDTHKYLYVFTAGLCKIITWDLRKDWEETHINLPVVTPVFKTIVTDLIIEKPIDNELKDELKLLEEQQREIAEKMKELQEKIGK